MSVQNNVLELSSLAVYAAAEVLRGLSVTLNKVIQVFDLWMRRAGRLLCVFRHVRDEMQVVVKQTSRQRSNDGVILLRYGTRDSFIWSSNRF